MFGICEIKYDNTVKFAIKKSLNYWLLTLDDITDDMVQYFLNLSSNYSKLIRFNNETMDKHFHF